MGVGENIAPKIVEVLSYIPESRLTIIALCDEVEYKIDERVLNDRPVRGDDPTDLSHPNHDASDPYYLGQSVEGIRRISRIDKGKERLIAEYSFITKPATFGSLVDILPSPVDGGEVAPPEAKGYFLRRIIEESLLL